jgi:hypothetical protein
MPWKTFYFTFGFAIAVIFATSSHDGAMLVKTDRLSVTPAPSGFNMERFAG